ncbi:MAG: zinc ribbon domain-containing protein [Planctomycetia bacterium]|nr:zinc ribbon domain-containing protein [Planctomycetia bacterium]
MPLYKYEHVSRPGDGCEKEFEVLQSRTEKALDKCPECGKKCRRLFCGRVAAIKSERDTLSTKNLERHGFTQYKKAGDGFYEKTAGDGPQIISADEARKLQQKKR